MRKISDNLPPFYKKQVKRLMFPMAWQNQCSKQSYEQWKVQAQNIYLEHLGPAPLKTSFDVEYIGKEDRGSYIAAIACPKPMLFFNGTKDTLFGIAGVNRCYKKMSEVWHSQNADNNLYCKWWEEPHHFNLAMQQDAFAWLDEQLTLGEIITPKITE